LGPEGDNALVELRWPCLLRPEGALRVVDDIRQCYLVVKVSVIRELWVGVAWSLIAEL
jgi:hypothetical protein